jgi:type I restriction enzyme R subunit
VQSLDVESQRAIREGLKDEALAIYDLHKIPGLSRVFIKHVKQVAVDLLASLKTEKLKIDHWDNKEFTRNAVRVAIHDFLWSGNSDLPLDSNNKAELTGKTEIGFRHV